MLKKLLTADFYVPNEDYPENNDHCRVVVYEGDEGFFAALEEGGYCHLLKLTSQPDVSVDLESFGYLLGPEALAEKLKTGYEVLLEGYDRPDVLDS